MEDMPGWLGGKAQAVVTQEGFSHLSQTQTNALKETKARDQATK